MRKLSIVFTISTVLATAGCAGEAPPAGGDDDVGGDAPDAAVAPVIDAAPGAPDATSAPEPGDGVDFLDFPAQRGDDPRAQGDVMPDVASHLPASYGDEYYFDDPITWAHETTHGIDSELRNHYNDTGKRANGFYVLEDRAVIIVEPDVRKSDANEHVPESLRGFRYDTYLAGQEAWDDTPTYLFDEWVAYTNGGAVGVDLVQQGLFGDAWQDGVYGQLEFVVYAMALGMAVDAKDHDYFESYPQFREFLAWNTRRAMDVFALGRAMTQFTYDVQDDYLSALRTSADAAELRAWVKSTYGAAWTMEVLGF